MRAIPILPLFTLGLACSSGSSSPPIPAANDAPALTESTDPMPRIQPSGGLADGELEKLEFQIREEFPQVARIDVETLARRLLDEDAPLLIDVREAEEYAVSHLPGARRAATVTEALAILDGVSKDREIVVYCSIGFRSGRLAGELQGEGYTRVRNLEGSIFKWANTGHAVYRDGQVVREVHPYDTTWGRLLERDLWPEDE